MEQLQQLKAIGLRTFENQFSAPEGGMSLALDVLVDRPDVIETVRAYDTAGISSNAYGVATVALTQVLGNLVAAGATAANAAINAAGKQIYYLGNGALPGSWQILTQRFYRSGTGGQQNTAGPFAVDNKLDCFAANSNVYIACDAGVFRLETPSDVNVRRFGAGMPRGTNQGPTFSGAAPTLQLPGYGAARYRTLFLRKDSHGNLVAGEPSPAFTIFNNAAGTAFIQILALFPATGLEPGDLFQVYRSETTTGALNVLNQPSDELQLVLEYVITAGDLAAAWPNIKTFNDNCPDGARGAFLYTNQNSGQGILQANTRPPLAKCATTFKSVAWYANTKTQESLTFSLLDITSWTAATTTLSVTNGVRTYTYTHIGASTNNLIGAVARQIASSISGSAGSQNNDLGAFCEETILWSTAPALSGPGTVTLQTYGKGTDSGGPWTVTLAGGGASDNSTSPVLTASGSNRTLVSDDGPNRLYFSKPGQPEHVPALNYVEIGTKGDPIVAIAGLRDSLFVFKALDGVFRVTGTTAQDIRVESFDPTTLITQANSVGKAGNKLFVACNKGIVVISESGVESPPATRVIEADVLGLCANPLVGTSFVGRGCESERKYVFVANGGTIYSYNYELKMWTTRSLPTGGTRFFQCMTSGIVGATGAAGQLSDRFIFGDNNSSTLFDIIPPAAANPNVYTALAQFAYVVIDGNNPGLKKRFNDVSIVISGSTVTALNVGFNTETTPVTETVSVPVVAGSLVARVQVPRSCSYASQLTLIVSAVNNGEYLRVSGVSVTTEGITTRTTR